MNNKKYKTLVIDPPWSEVGGGKIKRGAQKHYSVMKTPVIIETIMRSKPFGCINEDAHLYLWVTNGFLRDGLKVMEALGFAYKTNWVWVKDRFGLGQYHRGQHELVLFGIRGKGYNVKTESRSIASIIPAKRRAHSQKPEEFYDMVEKRSIGPYIDMFHRGRSRNMHWDIWGHEAIHEEEQAATFRDMSVPTRDGVDQLLRHVDPFELPVEEKDKWVLPSEEADAQIINGGGGSDRQ